MFIQCWLATSTSFQSRTATAKVQPESLDSPDGQQIESQGEYCTCCISQGEYYILQQLTRFQIINCKSLAVLENGRGNLVKRLSRAVM